MTEPQRESTPTDASIPAGSIRSHRSPLILILEVFLISAGVFLGLAGEQWREDAEHRSAAVASLHRFRSEIETNKKSILAVQEYHVTLLASLRTYFRTPEKDRSGVQVKMQGLRPAFFEHSAWDLSLATRSLADIDTDVAFSLARIYNAQATYNELSRGIMQSFYINADAMRNDRPAVMAATEMYFADVTTIESGLLNMYDEIMPKIAHALRDQ